MLVCFLACSFLGIPYVPIDESVPKNRIMDILEKVKPQFILNTSNQNFFDFGHFLQSLGNFISVWFIIK
jgi:long-subunit acyl-CoA synthetase (AMP-forming)